MGNGDPEVDDWEVTFLRGGGWAPQSNHFDLLPYTTRWMMGA